MQTECHTQRLDFQPLATRDVRGLFDGGAITSDAGALLLHLEPRRSEVSRSVIIWRGGLTEIILSFGRSAIVAILKCSNVIDHRPPGHGMPT